MKRFSIVNNGYDINEVNRFIDIVIERLEKLNAENALNVEKIAKLNEQLSHSESGNNGQLEKAILAVQTVSDKIEEMAKNEAEKIVDEAKSNANSIVHEALMKARETENKRLELEKNIKVYKDKVRSLMESQMSLIDELDSPLTDVDN